MDPRRAGCGPPTRARTRLTPSRNARPLRRSSFAAVRHQSTARQHPRDKALSLVNMAPGENLIQKTSFITAFAGLAAYAISKEIYIIEAETLEGLCMIGAFTVWYSAVKDTARDFFNDQKEVRFGVSGRRKCVGFC